MPIAIDRFALLNSTCTVIGGRFGFHKVCRIPDKAAMTTVSCQLIMPAENNSGMKLGLMQPSIPGRVTFKVDPRSARRRHTMNRVADWHCHSAVAHAMVTAPVA